MSNFPSVLDSDVELPRVDDNLTEIGSEAINALRDATFSIEKTLGINPQGSAGTVSTRFDLAHNADGSIKASALTSIGLVTLPITDNQVAVNAGIKEYKLSLNHSTSDLYTLIIGNSSLVNSVSAFSVIVNGNLLSHIAGAKFLNDNTTLSRHVASQIDINNIPSDSRDALFTWTGLLDKNGVVRNVATVAEALLEINNDLIGHENSILNAHSAKSITVDTSKFVEISNTVTNVQEALEAIDDGESRLFKPHRANLHANGISRTARSFSFSNPDGYSQSIIPPTSVSVFLVHSPANSPVDSVINGDNLIVFTPDDSSFIFDSQFKNVRVGDIIRVEYGGVEQAFPIESIRFNPGSEWAVRITSSNLRDGYGFARIDKSIFDTDINGILAVAPANQTLNTNIFSSLIIADPKAPSVLGLGFNATKLDNLHYNLYLQMYPTGNPSDKVISLPAIDVTGNAGATPGSYTLESIVQATNNVFRSPGFNFRFIAFSHNGEFGIALADTIGGVGFSIVSGTISGSSLAIGSFVNNVIGDALDNIDPLGLGNSKADVASPAYSTSFSGSAAALLATKIYLPLKNRRYDVNGVERDNFAPTYLSVGDGYWPALLTARTAVGATTIEVTYQIPFDLRKANLANGKTIVVQPVVSFTDATYNNVDYGRFFIKEIGFDPCGILGPTTTITVMNGLHGFGAATGFSSPPGLAVKIYFSNDSVTFNTNNVFDSSSNLNNYNRLHEIYIDEFGKTFSHERARMPQQSGTLTLLDTTDGVGQKQWNITDVSPKLRGFRDDGSISLAKYVRFYVISYDTVTGEYDGYIGKRDSVNENITNTGLIIKAKKGIPTKFYDETNIDFIELQFIDLTTSSGNVIVIGPRYVDIQLFPTLQLDNEILKLATCEVKNTSVLKLKDARQFGTISENNFTDSAIDFIRVNDRELRQNGIVRGFDFVSISLDSLANPKILNYNGGVAFVNGSVVVVNNGSVEIPMVYSAGTSLPQTLTWAICINKFGQFQPLLLTSTKIQSFIRTIASSTGYFIDSASFTELINDRKDLAVIEIVTATINSIVLSRTDAKRYITSTELSGPFVWSGTNNIGGQFKSFEAVKNWINNYGSITNRVQLRGVFSISTALDFSNFNVPVIFDAENATLNIVSGKGIIIGSGVTLKNFNFNYNPTGIVYTSGDLVNMLNGCIFNQSALLKDAVIDNCIFTGDVSLTARPPFISVVLANNTVVDGLIIKNCKFNDSSSTSKFAAISIVTTNSGTDTTPGLVVNISVENNICNLDQGIYITTQTDGSLVAQDPGLSVSNVIIKNNSCGFIGHLTTSNARGTGSVRGSNRTTGLSIINNTCHIISILDSVGNYISASSAQVMYGNGNVDISNNFCNQIITLCQDTASINDKSSVTIKNNKLNAFDFAFLNSFGTQGNITAGTGILADNNALTSTNKSAIIIEGNILEKGRISGVTYLYNTGIQSNSSCMIKNNVISGLGLTNSGIGIYLTGGPASTFPTTVLCNQNEINRGTLTIGQYILISTGNIGFVTENIFDFPTVDGSDTSNVIFNASDGSVNTDLGFVIAERNKNQTAFRTFSSFQSGGISVLPGVGGPIGMGNNGLASSTIAGLNNTHITTSPSNEGVLNPSLVTNSAPANMLLNLSIPSNNQNFIFHWVIDLQGELPENVRIMNVAGGAKCDQNLVTGSYNLNFGSGSSGMETDSWTGNPGGIKFRLADSYVAGTHVVDSIAPLNTNGFTINNNNFKPMLWFTILTQNNSGSTANLNIDSIIVTYRW